MLYRTQRTVSTRPFILFNNVKCCCAGGGVPLGAVLALSWCWEEVSLGGILIIIVSSCVCGRAPCDAALVLVYGGAGMWLSLACVWLCVDVIECVCAVVFTQVTGTRILGLTRPEPIWLSHNQSAVAARSHFLNFFFVGFTCRATTEYS